MNPCIVAWIFCSYADAYVEKHQDKYLLLGCGLCNIINQKVGEETKGKWSIFHSF